MYILKIKTSRFYTFFIVTACCACRGKQAVSRFLMLGAVVAAVFAISFGPFILAGQLQQVCTCSCPCVQLCITFAIESLCPAMFEAVCHVPSTFQSQKIQSELGGVSHKREACTSVVMCIHAGTGPALSL